MKKTIDEIKKFFDKNQWKYNFDEDDKVFVSGLNMGNVLGNVKILIPMYEDHYNVYSILNSKAEKKYYPVIAEFLHRANYGLRCGNFEMDYEDGEIRYKTYVNFNDTSVSEEIVEESILVGMAMIDTYGKGLVKLMLGEGKPEEIVEYCESLDEEE